MKYRFSIQWLFAVTTAVSLLLAIAMRLKLLSGNRWTLAALGFYYLIYLLIAFVFFGPRYLRELKEFRASRREQRATRTRLEQESQKLLENFMAEREDGSAQEGNVIP